MSIDEQTNLTELLRTNIVEVNFTKVDGTDRVMRCTLQPEYLPESIEKEGVKVKNDYVTSVWDIDSNGWRSFRNDLVKEFKIV
jgi:WYL_2, Sm-like SH3 beta-barrel fold